MHQLKYYPKLNAVTGSDKLQNRPEISERRAKKKRFNRMMTHNWDYTLLEQLEQEYIEHKLEAHLK